MMKRIFSIFLICSTLFVFGEDEPTPVFEEAEEDVKVSFCMPFAAEEPVFEEEEEEDYCTCDEDDCDCDHSVCAFAQFNPAKASYVDWHRYKANFGIEKLLVRFPQTPAINHSATLTTAYAYDNAILYSLSGYFPPMSNIEPISWFDALLCTVTQYPHILVNNTVFQAFNGDWIMDYVYLDDYHKMVIKARAIVTPFNAYTLQCAKPNGMRDYFDYFLDNFLLKREIP